MLFFASHFYLAQAIPAPVPQQVILPREVPSPEEEMRLPPSAIPPKLVFQPQEVRPLPGQLDSIPVFNSNSPEVVQTEGILLSTFPANGKRQPGAHLNFPFKGRFDLFTHHVAKARTAAEIRTLFHGILVYNPTSRPVTLEVLQGASYLTKPDALFVDLPAYLENRLGNVFAGPGSRTTNDVLRGRRQGILPATLEIPPQQSRMLKSLPIPVGRVVPSSNSRTTLMRLLSSDTVYVASLAMFAPKDARGLEQAPTLQQWETLLQNGDVAGPRDLPPTPPNVPTDRMIYGRVAGVAQGSLWRADITDNPRMDYLSLPQSGQAVSYGISTLPRGTLGTGQVQSARMLVRYPDTAYYAHGNYGVEYNLSFPLKNTTNRPQRIAFSLQTPVKDDQAGGGLRFFDPPENRVFFRGTVRLVYDDDQGSSQVRYIHIVQRRGQQGEPLISLNVKPGERRSIQVDFLYPPDATPPQVVTIRNNG